MSMANPFPDGGLGVPEPTADPAVQPDSENPPKILTSQELGKEFFDKMYQFAGTAEVVGASAVEIFEKSCQKLDGGLKQQVSHLLLSQAARVELLPNATDRNRYYELLEQACQKYNILCANTNDQNRLIYMFKTVYEIERCDF